MCIDNLHVDHESINQPLTSCTPTFPHFDDGNNSQQHGDSYHFELTTDDQDSDSGSIISGYTWLAYSYGHA